MKKPLLLILALLILHGAKSQQEIIDHWTLHYMVIDGITYNVDQPHPSNPSYWPGIEFFDDSSGYQVTGFIHFNSYFDSEPPVIIGLTTFTVNNPSATLGDCFPFCELEGRYLGTILSGSAPRTFSYEIIDEGSGNRTLTITTPEGNIAVHGNYSLSIDSFDKTNIKLYPNPVENSISISSSEELSVQQVRVLSLSGTAVIDATTNNVSNLDLSLLASGLYFLELTLDGNKKYVQKFIKK